MIPARKQGREEGIAYTLAELLELGLLDNYQVRAFLEERALDPHTMAASPDDRRWIKAAWTLAAPQ